MTIAAIGDTPYNIVLILHILTAMVAFAPAFAHPILGGQAKTLDQKPRLTMLGFLVTNGRRIYAPALIVTGLLGFALSGMSSSVFKMSQTWLILSAIVWLAMNGVLHAVLLPAEKAMAEGDTTAEQKVKIGGISIAVMLVVMLYLMVFKPGL